MKKVFLIVLVCIVSFWSCQNDDNQLADIQNKSLSFQDFFEKISTKDIKVEKEKVLLINYEWNAKESTITLIDSQEAEPSWGLALDIAEKKKTQKRGEDGKEYSVSCDKGGKDGKGWTKSCSGKFSCGSLAYDCLNAGGCATICKAPMVYVPDTKEFYIPSDRDITQLIELPIKQ